MSDSQDLATPVSSSKLVPAAAPSVSAWGKKIETPETTPSSQNIKKEEWPTVDVVLSKEASNIAVKEVSKEKPKPAPPKVKSTGKEKWVPYEATIILPSGNNGNQQQKKKNNSGNSSNGGNDKQNNGTTNNGNSSSKKKQNQSSNQNNQSNQNNGGKQKRDSSANRNNQNGQKKQSDGNNGAQQQQQQQQQKKKNGNTGQPNSSNNKQSKSLSEGVASLNLKKEKREVTVASSSTTKSPSPTAQPAVTASTDATPKNQNAKLAVTSPIQESNTSTTTVTTAATAVSDATDATSPISQHSTNAHKQSGANTKRHQPPQPQQYQPQQMYTQQYQLQQPQLQQHRNSEPFASGVGNFYNNSNTNNNGYGNRGRKQNKQFDNSRHSIAGAGYGNVPFYNYNNYGYMPMMNVNSQYGYTNTYNNFAKVADGRSRSNSPTKGDFSATLNTVTPGIPGISPFAPQPVVFNPYNVEADPLTTVVNQLNYYFSNENLIKDFYLRRQMNSRGYVPLKKLIEFNRLKALTGGDYDMMLNALKLSPNLEVHNDKVRVINTWMNWILPFDQRDETGKLEDDETKNDENQS